jgi:hypothetical protein
MGMISVFVWVLSRSYVDFSATGGNFRLNISGADFWLFRMRKSEPQHMKHALAARRNIISAPAPP